MSTPAPWEPQSGGGTGSPGSPDQPGTPAAPQELIDPNDPRLVSEALDVDLTKDAYATPSLPPDGKYRAKLKHEGMKDDKNQVIPYAIQQTKNPVVPYFATGVSATILDATGRFDGFIVRPAFGGTVGTLLRKDHSSQASTLLNRIRKADGNFWVSGMPKMSHKDWIDLLIKALMSEPEIGIETQWEWSCQKCGEAAKASNYKDGYGVRIQGMQRFPAETDPAKRKLGDLFSPEMQCQKDKSHGYTRGYPRIARFLSLDELAGKVPVK